MLYNWKHDFHYHWVSFIKIRYSFLSLSSMDFFQLSKKRYYLYANVIEKVREGKKWPADWTRKKDDGRQDSSDL